jgi:hypothetical protein
VTYRLVALAWSTTFLLGALSWIVVVFSVLTVMA